MTFFESIKTVFSKYADFTGKATRPEFWWFTLFSALVAAALKTLNVYTTNLSELSVTTTISSITFGASLAGLWGIVVLLPSLAVAVRRLRDTGRDWTQLFWILLPIAGAIVLIVRLAEPSITSAPVTPAPVAKPPVAKTAAATAPAAKAPTKPGI